MTLRRLFIYFSLLFSQSIFAQKLTEKVNVFLGTSGDHGQLSPAASYPFSMLSIAPQTYPNLHAGYEYKAKKVLGFTHTRMEGVGCMGAGGNFLLKPILNYNPETELLKLKDSGKPGYYCISFKNGIKTEATVAQNFGIYGFSFPEDGAGFTLDLGFAFLDHFIDCQYQIKNNRVLGFADAKTTCGQGVYRTFFCFSFQNGARIKVLSKNKLLIENIDRNTEVKVGLSAVSEVYAEKRINDESFNEIKKQADKKWNSLLKNILVKGKKEDENLFYSLLYRTLQSPFLISENDGSYRAIDGTLQHSNAPMYHGWAIWDNYRELFPLYSLAYPEYYKDFVNSIVDMYFHGKTQWSTEHAPSLTVRTEHSVVLLLDAYNKGIVIPVNKISQQIIDEVEAWDTTKPDKALEACIDYWAASELFKKAGMTDLAEVYRKKSLSYREVWLKNFKDIHAADADKVAARGMYQGTVLQYRWLVPYDIKGLKSLAGSDEEFLKELDYFFDGDYYNMANEPDIQVPSLYNATSEPWKSQALIHKFLKEDVIQYYFNENLRGIEPYIGKVFRNQPEAYLRTMDDDAGAMSSWWILRSLGFSSVNPGENFFYLNAPVFKLYSINKRLFVRARNLSGSNVYIKKLIVNEAETNVNWIDVSRIMKGAKLEFTLAPSPNLVFGLENQKISQIQ